MITQDNLLKSISDLQMRWAERNFSTIELYHNLLIDCRKSTDEYIFYPQKAWPININASESKASTKSLHCLTPHPLYYSTVAGNDLSVSMGVMRTLVHLCDFLFPLFGATSEGLDKMTLKIPAVYRVDHFLKTRWVQSTQVCCSDDDLWQQWDCVLLYEFHKWLLHSYANPYYRVCRNQSSISR